jgi:hypothetical protein
MGRESWISWGGKAAHETRNHVPWAEGAGYRSTQQPTIDFARSANQV